MPVYSIKQMHAVYLKEQYPDAVLVYISPCISVMADAEEGQAQMDYVITFRELNNWMKDVSEKPKRSTGEKGEVYLSRMTAVSGGLSRQCSL